MSPAGACRPDGCKRTSSWNTDCETEISARITRNRIDEIHEENHVPQKEKSAEQTDYFSGRQETGIQCFRMFQNSDLQYALLYVRI